MGSLPNVTVRQPARSSSAVPGRADRLLGLLQQRVLWIQVGLMVLIAVLHASLTWPPEGTFEPTLTQAFDVDHEMNFPTWFASMQHFLVGLTLVATATVVRIDRRSLVRAWPWAVGAAAAFYLSADEISAFHERLGGFLEFVLRRQDAESPLRGLLRFPSYYWMLVYAPIVIPALVAVIVFARRHLGSARRLAFLGIFVFLYGAVGLDFIEGHFGTTDHSYLVLVIGSRPVNFDIFLLEEILEMTGVAMILHALLTHLKSRVAGLFGD